MLYTGELLPVHICRSGQTVAFEIGAIQWQAVHVLLDTSIYRRDPARRSAAFQTLARLAAAELIHLHLPWVAKREFETYLEDKCADKLRQIPVAVNGLKRSLPESLHDRFDATLEASNALKEGLAGAVLAEFEEWLANVKMVIHEVDCAATPDILNAYFAGTVPFRSRKSRDDFPDAFIWWTAHAIAAEQGHLSLVTADGGLAEAATGDDSVTTYGSLDVFIESDHCQELLRAHFASVNIGRLRAVLPAATEGLQPLASAAIEGELENWMVNSNQIPEDNAEARIAGVGEVTDLSLDATKAQDYGDGVIVIPFSANSESLLNYCIFIADYYGLDEERSKHISISSWNEHYYDAEEYYELDIEGRLTILLDVDQLRERELDETELAELAATAEVEVDAIESVSVSGD